MRTARANDLNVFLQRRQPDWRRLEALLETVEQSGLASLPPGEVREFGALYRRASSDLIAARAKTANAEVLQYLNDLVARSYSQIYRSRRFNLSVIWVFLAEGFPRLYRDCGRYVALAGALFMVGVVLGWEVNRRDPAGAYYLVSPELVKQIPAMRSMWSKQTGHADLGPNIMQLLSTFLMTHNIGVGMIAFCGGIFFGIGPLWAMIQNGLMLGVLGEAMSRPETALVFWSLILPHGVIEIPAICVMGGAGFVLAGALLAPGKRTRLEALIERGKLAVLLAAGGAAMLVLAGIIEGFITPMAVLHPFVKLAFAAVLTLAQIAYFALAGKSNEAALQAS